MVSDRLGFLSVQAAAEGSLDFRQADRFDRNWWRRCRLVLEYLDRQNLARLYTQDLGHCSQQLTAPPIYMEPAVSKIYHDRTAELQSQLESAYRPWIKFQVRTTQDTIKAMSAKYAEVFMDPNTPEFDAELARLQAYWASDKDEDE